MPAREMEPPMTTPDPRLPLSAESLCDIEACGDCRSWVTPLVTQARAALELAAELDEAKKLTLHFGRLHIAAHNHLLMPGAFPHDDTDVVINGIVKQQATIAELEAEVARLRDALGHANGALAWIAGVSDKRPEPGSEFNQMAMDANDLARTLYDAAWAECKSGRTWVADQRTGDGATHPTYGEYSPEYMAARAAHDAARKEAGLT